MKQIISIGGGGFSHHGNDLTLERYIVSQSQSPHPKVCFLPQASNESPTYIIKFLESFIQLGAQPSWVSLFGRVEETWKTQLLAQDIIYVGGGNTKSMLALWKAWGLDQVLREAYDNGIILAGVSAGAICWFDQAITDSVWPIGVIEGLGFLPGSACPHFDSEVERPEAYRHFVATGQAKPGIALDDFTAAHFIDGTLFKEVGITQNRKIYKIDSA